METYHLASVRRIEKAIFYADVIYELNTILCDPNFADAHFWKNVLSFKYIQIKEIILIMKVRICIFSFLFSLSVYNYICMQFHSKLKWQKFNFAH